MFFALIPLKPYASPAGMRMGTAVKRGRRLSHAMLTTALSAVLLAPLVLQLPAQAAVLSEAQVRSYLGQKLDAEIEISGLTAAEAEALLVRIPPADAFASAGIDMATLVRSLRLTLEKRGEQTFVRVNSDQAVTDPFLMLLVELNAGGTRTVRQYALLIDPAPLERAQPANVEPAVGEPMSHPNTALAAPDAAPATASPADTPAGTNTNANASASSTARFTATTTRRVRKGETLVAIGNDLKPEGVRLEQVLVALQRANPQAFAGNNINRMKSGSVLSVPSADSMRALDANAARRIVIAQSADFQRYRTALAERMNAPARPAGTDAAIPAAGNRSSSGAVGVTVQEPGARPQAQDQLKLTAPSAISDTDGKRIPAADASATNDKRAIDQLSADKALADANSRIAALEKNLSRMEQMLEVRDRKLADAQKAATAPADPSAAGTITGAPKDKLAESAKSSKSSLAPATPVAWADYLQAPLVRVLAAAAVLLALLAWLLRLRSRRSDGKQGRKRSKVNLVGSGTGQAAAAVGAMETRSAADAEVAAQPSFAAAAPASVADRPALAALNNAVRGTVTGANKGDGSEVDAIAEADVYIAYGRDEQAEEILRDTLRTQPLRDALRVKLLEIYAARRDRKSFGELAAELHAVTAGKGSEWEQAAQMGQLLDPDNPLYGALPQPASKAPQRSVFPALSSVHATDTQDAKSAAALSVDDFGLKLEGLLDEQRREQGKLPPALQPPMQPSSAAAAPDFSLSGLARGEPTGQRIEPMLNGEPDAAVLTTKLDLAVACEEIGDHEGARELLAEVASARNPELSRRAQDLLRKLA
jgi:pilus assembly protein FimV